MGGGAGSFLSEPVVNLEANALLAGEVVRIAGNSAILRSQADALIHMIGLVGATESPILTGAIGQVKSEGRGFVLLEPALAPVAGQTLWVSATVAGRATNVIPPLRAYFGIIKDASMYAATGGVIADIDPGFTVSIAVAGTLSNTYATGVAAADQTMMLSNANGGGVVINATDPTLNGAVTAFDIEVIGGSTIFYNRGGFRHGLRRSPVRATVARSGTRWLSSRRRSR